MGIIGTVWPVWFLLMVVKVTRKRVCDICESEDGVCRYRITRLEDGDSKGQQTVTADLCAEHSKGARAVLEKAPAPRRGRKPVRPVVSLDEIEAEKKPARKKAVSTSRRKK